MKKWMMTVAITFGTSAALMAQEIDTIPEQDTSIVEPYFGEIDPATDTAAPQGEALIDTIPVTDGFYQANNLEDAVPFAYPEVNRKNIRFYKRVWRDIDLKNEDNYIYAIPGNSLMEVIMKAIEDGKLTPYSPEDDSFKERMSASEGIARFADSVLVPIFDDQGNQIDAQMTLNEFNPERVTKFRIKEDIFFDRQRGRLETRIIGVAPLMDITTSAELSESIGATPAFWLYFPQLRYALVKVDISDPDRGLYDMTMDDLFVQRKFASQIVRESSPGMLQQASMDGGSQTENPEELEAKLEAYKNRLWTTHKGVEAEQLEHYEQDVKHAEEQARRREEARARRGQQSQQSQQTQEEQIEELLQQEQQEGLQEETYQENSTENQEQQEEFNEFE